MLVDRGLSGVEVAPSQLPNIWSAIYVSLIWHYNGVDELHIEICVVTVQRCSISSQV